MVGGRRIAESTPPPSWVVAGEGGRRRKMKVSLREIRYDVVGCIGCV